MRLKGTANCREVAARAPETMPPLTKRPPGKVHLEHERTWMGMRQPGGTTGGRFIALPGRASFLHRHDAHGRQLRRGFAKIRCLTEDHLTPFNTLQNFLFCSFRRLAH